MSEQPHENHDSRLLNVVRREPLVHFLGLAALLFAVNAVFAVDEREIITVDVATQEFLVKQEQDLLLRPLNEDEKQRVVESFIENEILVREARKRGLDNSSRIRRLLIQNMRFFVANELPQPDDQELRKWFEANLDRFESPPSITFDHVFFNEAANVPADLLEQLDAGADHTRLGDFSTIGTRLVKMSERAIASSFGPEEAPRVIAIADQRWHGPFSSPRGVHFLRIAERHPPVRPSFEAAANWVEQEWLLAKQRELMDRELAGMRESYHVVVLAPGQDNE